MAVIPQQRQGQWKESAIIRSEVVTDTWDVTKAWAGRFAEWVLFLCMIANIVQILPGVQLSGWFSNTVLGFQAVTLDVAGFGLATLAEHARVNGDTHTARTAQRTAYLLIGIMLVTVLSVALGDLWPALKVYTDSADRGLILVRVGMTVVYGHVVHGLRRHSPSQNMAAASISVLERWEARLGAMSVQQDATTQAIARVMETIQQVRTEVSTLEQGMSTMIAHQITEALAAVQREQQSEQQAYSRLEQHVQRVQQSVQGVQEHILALAATPVQGVQEEGEKRVQGGQTGEQQVSTEQRIRTILEETPDASVRSIATSVGCSPTTANKWITRIRGIPH